MDRNRDKVEEYMALWVAPLAGSVDRNNDGVVRIYTLSVAPLAGSVDRNIMYLMNNNDRQAGRSPRGERG